MAAAKEKKINIHAHHRERMRKRFSETEGSGFQDHEILEFLLFYGIPRANTNEISHMLLHKFGSLEGVMSASCEELMLTGGIGETSAMLLKTVFEIHMRIIKDRTKEETYKSFEEIGECFMKLFTHIKVETVILLLFDKCGRINRNVTVSAGDSNKAVVDMKKIISAAMSEGAVAAAVAHNHPGGILKSSYDDRVVTLQLNELLQSLGIKLIDHYIITENGYRGIINDKFSENILEI